VGLYTVLGPVGVPLLTCSKSFRAQLSHHLGPLQGEVWGIAHQSTLPGTPSDDNRRAPLWESPLLSTWAPHLDWLGPRSSPSVGLLRPSRQKSAHSPVHLLKTKSRGRALSGPFGYGGSCLFSPHSRSSPKYLINPGASSSTFESMTFRPTSSPS
jgi:hypothetical protein